MLPALTLSWTLGLMLLLAAPATEPSSVIKACAQRKLPEHSSVQTVEIRSLDTGDLETVLAARIYWKRLDEGRISALVRLLGPDDVAGMSFLVRQPSPDTENNTTIRGNEMFMYLPELRRVRRVSIRQAAGSLFGTAFSYEDFERVQGLAKKSRIESEQEQEIGGRSAYVVTAYPGDSDGSAYGHIRSFTDKLTCLPLKVDFFDATGNLAKQLKADPAKFDQVNGVWVAHSFSMTDFEGGTTSQLTLQSIEIDGDLPDRFFVPASLADEF